MEKNGRPENKSRILRKLATVMRHPASSGVKLSGILRRALWPSKPYIFVACMPKSASTFITDALADLTGFRKVSLAYRLERNEQDLYLPRVTDANAYPSVTQQHMRATVPNLDILNRFGIRSVVLVRSLFDVVVSIRAHTHRESTAGPAFFADEDYFSLSESRQYDFIIDMAMPWYFNFYCSWCKAFAEGGTEAMWLTYEDFTADNVAALESILSFYDLHRSRDEIETTLEKTEREGSSRLHTGKVGRGMSELSSSQIRRLVSFCRYYPGVDFSRAGITPELIRDTSDEQ